MAAVFFLALSIPAGVLVRHAYSQLKWEAFHHYQGQAEELAARIDDRLIASSTARRRAPSPITASWWLPVILPQTFCSARRCPPIRWNPTYPALSDTSRSTPGACSRTPLLPAARLHANRLRHLRRRAGRKDCGYRHAFKDSQREPPGTGSGRTGNQKGSWRLLPAPGAGTGATSLDDARIRVRHANRGPVLHRRRLRRRTA